MMQHHAFSRIVLAGSLVLPLAQTAMGQLPRIGFGQQPGAGQPAQPDVRPRNDLQGRPDANGRVDGGDRGGILRGSQIIGGTINLRGGSRFGAISDFVLGDGGCVDYVVANYQGQYVPIPWAAAMWQPGQRVLMVDIDPARIREIPMFRSFSELSNRQFSDRVHTFYRGTQGQRQGGDMHRGTNQQGAVNNNQPAPTAGRRPAGQPQRQQGNRTGRNETR